MGEERIIKGEREEFVIRRKEKREIYCEGKEARERRERERGIV